MSKFKQRRRVTLALAGPLRRIRQHPSNITAQSHRFNNERCSGIPQTTTGQECYTGNRGGMAQTGGFIQQKVWLLNRLLVVTWLMLSLYLCSLFHIRILK